MSAPINGDIAVIGNAIMGSKSPRRFSNHANMADHYGATFRELFRIPINASDGKIGSVSKIILTYTPLNAMVIALRYKTRVITESYYPDGTGSLISTSNTTYKSYTTEIIRGVVSFHYKDTDGTWQECTFAEDSETIDQGDHKFQFNYDTNVITCSDIYHNGVRFTCLASHGPQELLRTISLTQDPDDVFGRTFIVRNAEGAHIIAGINGNDYVDVIIEYEPDLSTCLFPVTIDANTTNIYLPSNVYDGDVTIWHLNYDGDRIEYTEIEDAISMNPQWETADVLLIESTITTPTTWLVQYRSIADTASIIHRCSEEVMGGSTAVFYKANGYPGSFSIPVSSAVIAGGDLAADTTVDFTTDYSGAWLNDLKVRITPHALELMLPPSLGMPRIQRIYLSERAALQANASKYARNMSELCKMLQDLSLGIIRVESNPIPNARATSLEISTDWISCTGSRDDYTSLYQYYSDENRWYDFERVYDSLADLYPVILPLGCHTNYIRKSPSDIVSFEAVLSEGNDDYI